VHLLPLEEAAAPAAPIAAALRGYFGRAGLAIDLASATGATAAAVAVGQALALAMELPNLSMIFLGAVLLCSSLRGTRAAILAACLSFLAYNDFFIQPLHTLTIARPHEFFALLIFLAVAALTGSLTGRIRAQAQAALTQTRMTEAQAAFSRRLSAASTVEDVAWVIVTQVHALMGGRAILFLAEGAELSPCTAWPPEEIADPAEMTAARWALDDRDAPAALRWLDDMPQGAARRTIALRLRLKAARLARQTAQALETARLLAKHRAFSEAAGQSLVRSLALELISGAYDPAQLQKQWGALDEAERTMPEVAIAAARRLLVLGGNVELSRQWLLPVWERMVQGGSAQAPALSDGQRVKLIQALELGFSLAGGAPDAPWLTRIESAQLRSPGDPRLQYLAGITCMHLKLWGKAQQLLRQSLPLLHDEALEQNAWVALAALAEQRDDDTAATAAYKSAVEIGRRGKVQTTDLPSDAPAR
jgi:HemY protein